MEHASIELVTLYPGARRVNVGNANPTWKAQALASNGRVIEIYLKRLGAREIFVECVAATLGRCLGLPIPRPLLVLVEPVRLLEAGLSEKSIFFGSQSASYPPLEQFIPFAKALDRLRQWPHAVQTGCFDEWLVNQDRHDGNVLYDGDKQFILIDHDKCLPAGFDSALGTSANKIFEKIRPQKGDQVGRKRVSNKARKSISEFMQLMSEDWLSLVRQELYYESEPAREVLDFLDSRLRVLSVLVAEKIGAEQGDMYGEDT